jgi:hypothetical protein
VSDTPRTDALMRPNGALATNLLEHARQLERELLKTIKQRDEARLAYKIIKDKYEATHRT